MNGVTSVYTYAQDVSDTTSTEIPADSTLEALDGIRFMYRPPESPVSIQKGVSPSGLYYIKSSNERYVTTWDSVENYTVQRQINGIDVSIPRVMDFGEFAQAKKENQKAAAESPAYQRRDEWSSAGPWITRFQFANSRWPILRIYDYLR